MVRNDSLSAPSGITKLIADTVNQLSKRDGLSQEEVGRVVGRSQSYASLRLKGLKGWTTDDLDVLAKKFGFVNAFELLDKARGIESSEGVNNEVRNTKAKPEEEAQGRDHRQGEASGQESGDARLREEGHGGGEKPETVGQKPRLSQDQLQTVLTRTPEEEARIRDQIAHPEKYDLAANCDSNKENEINTPRD